MNDPIFRHSVPSKLKEMEENLHVLRWIRGVRKELPSLPSGQLKEGLERDLDSISEGNYTSVQTIKGLTSENTQLKERLLSLREENSSLERNARSYESSTYRDMETPSLLKWKRIPVLVIGSIIILLFLAQLLHGTGFISW